MEKLNGQMTVITGDSTKLAEDQMCNVISVTRMNPENMADRFQNCAISLSTFGARKKLPFSKIPSLGCSPFYSNWCMQWKNKLHHLYLSSVIQRILINYIDLTMPVWSYDINDQNVSGLSIVRKNVANVFDVFFQ